MEFSIKQQEFYNAAISGKSIFLKGKAGTGKSFIVKKLIADLKGKVIALAPTGIAANNIGGQTIHSMFSLRTFGVLDFQSCGWLTGEKRRMLNKIDTIILDEVSMLRPDILDAINWTLIKNGCKKLSAYQIIFVGDMKQLPPPIDDNMRSMMLLEYEGIEFEKANIYKSLNIQEIELDEVLRQNNLEFVNNLNIIREGQKSEYFRQFVNSKTRGVILAPHNTTVARYNFDGLNSIDGEKIVFDAKVTGNVKAGDFAFETKVTVKPGCQIMYLFNSKNNNLINGTLGIFRHDGNNYFIDVKGVYYALEEITISKKEYVLNEQKDALELQEIGSITQMPIKLAYALSIHKSQGLTFEEVTIDLTKPCFAKGQLYVALSRVTSPEGLTIITK